MSKRFSCDIESVLIPNNSAFTSLFIQVNNNLKNFIYLKTSKPYEKVLFTLKMLTLQLTLKIHSLII